MSKPIVAIVGRPNVGKSTFFNFIAGKRISIVEGTPGVTRDRIYIECDWRGRNFTLIDTGGMEPNDDGVMMQRILTQAQIAVETADVIILMVDMKDGITSTDEEVSSMLRKFNKPLVLAVNKVDNIGDPPVEIYDFYSLGYEKFFPISSSHGLGIGDLLDEVYSLFPEEDEEEYDETVIKVAVVGKPNSGKSSLVNKILGEERVIVDNTPGTTRDAIDTYFEKDDDKYVFIDTAGIRKRSKINESIEKYSVIRSWSAIEKADVCLMMIDAEDGVTEQDSKIAGYAHEQGKAIIIVINKWDLIEKETGTMEDYREKVLKKLAFMSYAPVAFISALTGQRVDRLFDLIKYVADQSAIRITTGVLNELLNEAVAMVQPPSDKGKRLKVFYMTQYKVKPPSFIIFVNKADLMHYSYQRYIENQLRRSFGFEGTSIRLKIREKERSK